MLYKLDSVILAEEAGFTSYGFDPQNLQARHCIRLEGRMLVSKTTVYLILHLLDQMNKPLYEELVDHVGMLPAFQDDNVFDRTNNGTFSPYEVGIVFDRWSAQETRGPRRTRLKREVLDWEISRRVLRLSGAAS